ncbi:MAG: hypothetical protein ACOYYU_16450, partial [Chloroflexota bacterium]
LLRINSRNNSGEAVVKVSKMAWLGSPTRTQPRPELVEGLPAPKGQRTGQSRRSFTGLCPMVWKRLFGKVQRTQRLCRQVFLRQTQSRHSTHAAHLILLFFAVLSIYRGICTKLTLDKASREKLSGGFLNFVIF